MRQYSVSLYILSMPGRQSNHRIRLYTDTLPENDAGHQSLMFSSLNEHDLMTSSYHSHISATQESEPPYVEAGLCQSLTCAILCLCVW